MDNDIKNIITAYQRREISPENFIEKIPHDIKNNGHRLNQFLLEIIQSRNTEDLEDGLTIVWALKKENEQLSVLNQLLLEDWHTRHEEIIHTIQKIRNPNSIPFIKKAMQKKYPYLVSYGTGIRQFINQCGHALQSINTTESFQTIQELSNSKDPVLKDEMLYRLDRIEGRNDYKRDYNIE